jgi:predicted SnoaL-like aldol condensation-catalyzing enzyme
MSTDNTMSDNEALVTQLWDRIWISGDLDELEQLVCDPYIRHTRDGTVSAPPADYARHLRNVVRTIRGTAVTIEHIASVGDMVYARLNLEGVNLDTGNALRLTWLTQYRIADGKIAEAWTMHQSGLDW